MRAHGCGRSESRLTLPAPDVEYRVAGSQAGQLQQPGGHDRGATFEQFAKGFPSAADAVPGLALLLLHSRDVEHTHRASSQLAVNLSSRSSGMATTFCSG